MTLGVIAAALHCQPSEPQRRVDTLIRNAALPTAADERVDVAIDDGKIVAIGNAQSFVGENEIDANGLTLAPGFVDIHSHADLILLAEPQRRDALLEAKIRQGVTTIVVGNCGLGVAPADGPAAITLDAINGWMSPDGVTAGELSTADYLDRLESSRLPLNVATLVPHGPLRITAMGLADGMPDDGQLRLMRAELNRALDAGAFGMSVGLIYPPGMFSPPAELRPLAADLAGRGRLLTAHIRGSSETLLNAVDELIELAESSGVRAHHSHLEAVGSSHWDQITTVLAKEDAARERGVAFSHDLFPYTRAATMMAAIFPPWSLEGGVPKLLERLQIKTTRDRIERDIESRRSEWPSWQAGGWPHNLVGAVGWDGIYIASLGSGQHPEWIGRSLAEIAGEGGESPFDLVAGLMVDEGGAVGQLVGEISGDDDQLAPLLQILSHPATAIVSDAEDYGRGAPHPAHAGAFARALRLDREQLHLPTGEMLRRMTSRPAEIIGLEGVGRLEVGAAADLLLLDLTTVQDRADWAHPRAFADGIEAVMIGGEWVVQEGRYKPRGSGRLLRAN
jgi:N-acyl-D-aspartate/D-glutamate deacylase